MRVDSWQLGVLIFFLLTGAHPFGNVDCPGHATRLHEPGCCECQAT